MRLLFIHADKIRYKVTRKTPLAENISKKADEMIDCLVVFSCVEKLDERDVNKVVIEAKKEIVSLMTKLKTNRVMIFPFAHLSPSLSSPPVAINILTRLEKALREATEVEVKRAPFGWYKEWEIKDKGHPLSELSRVVCPYEAERCDFRCPYCRAPLILEQIRENK
jgi:threonyl-tRNA synthetase